MGKYINACTIVSHSHTQLKDDVGNFMDYIGSFINSDNNHNNTNKQQWYIWSICMYDIVCYIILSKNEPILLSLGLMKLVD